ncbi:hypothetical protein G6F32_017071 [Rhizopus arrhizus]|nr:hypothetical protein G6F32_017071 [Rhizopus arrhizus]
MPPQPGRQEGPPASARQGGGSARVAGRALHGRRRSGRSDSASLPGAPAAQARVAIAAAPRPVPPPERGLQPA